MNQEQKDHQGSRGPVIAIDGPSGAGKSTIARLLAERLRYVYIDTGAMYRAIGWKARRDGIDLDDDRSLASLSNSTAVDLRADGPNLRVLVDDVDVTGEIRTPEMGMAASQVSRSPAVRSRLLTIQRELGKQGRVVMDGRDIGTVVFPDAEFKFFLDATPEERGRRRYRELKEKGLAVDLERITGEIRERDRRDRERAIAPLVPASGAVVIDSTSMTIDQVVERLFRIVSTGKATVTA